MIIPSRFIQTGEYFGVEVCAMDLNSDGTTDLILISSPMHKDHDREGRVYVCELSRLVNVEFFMLIYVTQVFYSQFPC